MRLIFATAFLGLTVLITGLAFAAENPEVAKRRSVERKMFTDAEITYGFFTIAFGAELRLTQIDRIRKYDSPIRVYFDNRAKPDRRSQVAVAVTDIRSRVRNLDLAVTNKRNDANVFVTLVHDRDLAHTIRSIYGREFAQRIQRSLDPQCLTSFIKDKKFRIIRSEVILVVDTGEFMFYDCLYEEMLQALGPINDDPTVPWTMFNDDVHVGFFDVYDQYLLNLLYHPRIKAGMTRDEVRLVLPKILPEVRAWISEVNKLP